MLRFAALQMLSIQQTTCIAQDLVSANMAVSMLRHQAVNDFVNLAKLIFVWSTRGCSDLDHIAQVSEEFLLNGLLQAFVAGVVEGHALTSQRRDADEDFLAGGFLGIFGGADLLFNRAPQLLIRLHLFIDDKGAELGFI